MLSFLPILTVVVSASTGGVTSALDDLTTCKKLRANRCLVAASNLTKLGCKVTKKTSKRLAGMTTNGQILALDVLDACKSSSGSKALIAAVKNKKLNDVVGD